MATQLTLYRKYRPQTLSEVVGQAMPVRTLKNALARQDMAHAYLFHGPRGTGKTSLARIIARSLNCEKGLGADPCGQCQNCVDVLAGRNPEVVEMDAASHSKVEEVRRLTEQLWIPRTRNRYKVYILDEVHMLSTSAFNALLKAVEEPPEGLLFILATTEPHKVPATIRSRCQEFAFQRLSLADMQPALLAICGKEGYAAEEGVLAELCAASDGCMRDALSLLQQLASVTEGQLSTEALRRISGRLGEAELKDWLDLFKKAEGPALRDRLMDYYGRGLSLSMLVREMRRYLSELILSGADAAKWAGLMRWLDRLDHRLGFDKEPLLSMETALARWVAEAAAPPVVAAGGAPAPSAETPAPASGFVRRKPAGLGGGAPAPAPASAPILNPAALAAPPPVAQPAVAAAPSAPGSGWQGFLNHLMKTDVSLLAMLSQAEGVISGEEAVVSFASKWRVDTLMRHGKEKILEKHLSDFLGHGVTLVLKVGGETAAPVAPVAPPPAQTAPPAESTRKPARKSAPAPAGLPLDEGVLGRILKLAPGAEVEEPPK